MDGNQKHSAALDVVAYEALGGYQVTAVKLTEMKVMYRKEMHLTRSGDFYLEQGMGYDGHRTAQEGWFGLPSQAFLSQVPRWHVGEEEGGVLSQISERLSCWIRNFRQILLFYQPRY